MRSTSTLKSRNILFAALMGSTALVSIVPVSAYAADEIASPNATITADNDDGLIETTNGATTLVIGPSVGANLFLGDAGTNQALVVGTSGGDTSQLTINVDLDQPAVIFSSGSNGDAITTDASTAGDTIIINAGADTRLNFAGNVKAAAGDSITVNLSSEGTLAATFGGASNVANINFVADGAVEFSNLGGALTGNVTTTAGNGTGTLDLSNSGQTNIFGDIGASGAALKLIRLNGNDLLGKPGDNNSIFATTIEVGNVGATINIAAGTTTADIKFTGSANGDLFFNTTNATITGDVTTATDGVGTLRLGSTQTVTGNIGATGAVLKDLQLVGTLDGTVINGNVFAQTITVAGAATSTLAGATNVGNLNFTGNGEIVLNGNLTGNVTTGTNGTGTLNLSNAATQTITGFVGTSTNGLLSVELNNDTITGAVFATSIETAGTTIFKNNVTTTNALTTAAGGTVVFDSTFGDNVINGTVDAVAGVTDATMNVTGSTNAEFNGVIGGSQAFNTLNILNTGPTIFNEDVSATTINASAGTKTFDGIVTATNFNASAGTTTFNTSNSIGTLAITNGALVSHTGNGLVGEASGATETVLVTGTNSSWTSGGDIRVGGSGNGTLTIADGGAVSADNGLDNVDIALLAGSTGTLNIGAALSDPAAAAGTLNATTLAFGAGTGTLNFNHTETAYDFDEAITGTGTINQVSGVTNLTGDASGFTGTTNVAGGTLNVDNVHGTLMNVSGATLQTTDALLLDGTDLAISSGGTVQSNGTGSGGIGSNASSTGSASVTGAGSSLVMAGGLVVGGDNGSSGTLTISAGGAVSSVFSVIGSNATSTGAVTVTGAGSSWTNTSDLTVGDQGDATLIISDGGTVSSLDGFITRNNASTSSATVTGAGSAWTIAGDLTIGDNGAGIGSKTGTLTIADGGVVNVNSGSGTTHLAKNSDIGGILNIGAAAGDTAVAAGTLNAATLAFGDGIGTLNFKHTGTNYNFDAAITMSGVNTFATINHVAGVTNLTADSSGFAGDTIVNGGTLNITNKLGGAIVNIGDTSGSNGTVNVSGAAANWTTNNILRVGKNGTGTLTIADGGTVTNGSGSIGLNASSNGTVTVTGPGSSWTNTNTTLVASSGIGTLNVLNGATASAGLLLSIADLSSGQGTVNVSGAGSTLTSDGALSVGRIGTGTLTIADGGVVNANADTFVASFSGSTGTLNIGNGAAAGTLNSASVNFGNGTGSLNFNHTETAYDFGAAISGAGTLNHLSGATNLTADSSGFTGTTNITGGALNVTGTLGGTAMTLDDGALNVASGGSLNSVDGLVASASGSTGTATVTGAGSSWVSSNDLTVGVNGAGTLNVLDGATASASNDIFLGSSAGADGAVLVSGAGSTLRATDDVFVGLSGVGTLNIENGGAVGAADGFIASVSGSTGTVTVTGTGSTWTNTNILSIGKAGTGTLTIADGGAVGNVAGEIAFDAGSTGTATVTGAGSTWTNSGDLRVGVNGAGTLNVLSGASASAVQDIVLGIDTFGNGTALVSGAGSTLQVTDDIFVGNLGAGTLAIEDGGAVSSTGLGLVGNATGSTGTVTVTGAGSNWASAGDIRVGVDGTATLTIADSGVVDVGSSGSGAFDVAVTAGSTGTLNIGAAAGSVAAAAGTLNAATVAFGDGFGALNFNHTGTGYNFGAAITGAGTLNQIAGITNLTANSGGFTGDTSITGGTLSVNSTLGGTVNVAGGTLGGSGTLSGNVFVTNGVIAAGNSPGTLTIGGDLTLAAGSSLNFELGGPSGTAGVDSDLINVGGNLTLDGTLNVSDAGGFGAGLYRLVNYGGSLTDNGLEIGAAPNGFGSGNLTVQTAMANQVNLLVDAPLASFWDGGNTTANNAVDGGSGTWSVTGNNWTFADGSVNGVFDPSVLLIFTGTAGTVTVDDSAGAISTSAGMQFAVDGYEVTGDDIALTGATAFRVGDGTSTGAGFTAAIASNVTGTGSLSKTDLGTLVLNGTNSYTGGTTISGGTLVGNTTSLQGDIVNNAALTFDQTSDDTFAGVISGAGSLTKDGAGALTLTGTNSYTGGTTISGGTLVGDTTSLQGDIVNNAALTFGQASDGTYAGVISGTGVLTKDGAGALTLTGANAYTGGTTVSAGTLIGNTTSLQGNIVNNAALTFDQASAGTYAGVVSGTGALTKDGVGALTLTGANSYTGSTAISAGTLIGNATSLQGDIVNNAALTFDQGSSGTFAGAISGNGALTKVGAGELVLTGNSSAYAGTTDIAAGLLTIDGSLGGAINVSGGTLGGSGTLSGNVSVTNGAIAAGNGPGTLTIGGDLALAFGSSLSFELGSPTGTAGVDSDLINVGGNLTLDGTLDVADAGDFGAGLYRVINYGGSLTDNGLDVGLVPVGFSAGDLAVQTATAGQVNLLVATPVDVFSFWDGAGTVANGIVDGGDGSWTAAATNWTVADGSANGVFDPATLLIFAGAPGTVAVDDGAGAISTSVGMQFAVDGYTIVGDEIALTGATAFRVGDGTAAGAGFAATIAANLAGTGALEKTDLGTLVLAGTNSYTGGTTVSAGTLIGDTASLQSDIANNAALVFDQASGGIYAAVLSGTGALAKDGAGVLTLTGNSGLFAGGTNVSRGMLHVDGALGGSVSVAAGATLGGTGSVGDTVIAAGGQLIGDQGQTLTLASLGLDSGSIVSVSLGAPGTTALFDVTGDLTLDGTLDVTDAGGFGPGLYRLFDYGGTLDDQGLDIGSVPAGSEASDLDVQTAVAGQVNLVNAVSADDALLFWDGDGAGSADNGVIDGGSGVWSLTNPNWTNTDGTANGAMTPVPGFAVFVGAAGMVTADDTAGALSVTGMQFATDGYVLTGDAVELAGPGGAAIIRVGDGTAVSAGMAAVIASELTGSAALVKSDLGTLILTGANNYSGGTQVDSGVLQIGDGGTSGAILGDVLNDAVLAFNRSDAMRFDGTIRGSGAVWLLNGDLTLTADNDYTGGTSVAAGSTLAVGNGGTTGAIIGPVDNGGTLVFDRSNAYEFAGTISGTGTVRQIGSGQTELTGDSGGFTGTTFVEAGSLAVTGTLGGTIDVLTGGRLQGGGSLSDAIVRGTIAPGNSIGTLNVAGDIGFAAGSVYEVEANAAGQADLIVASGTTTLDGGTVQVLASAGDYAPATDYTILTANGGVTGTFTGGVTSNLAFLDPSLSYDANNVILRLARNDIGFDGIGRTPNQIAAGAGTESLGLGNDIFDAVLNLSADQARDAFDQLSGEVHASTRTAMLEGSRYVRYAVWDRLRGAARDDKGRFWGRGLGSWGHTSGNGNAARLDRSAGGMLMGGDGRVGDNVRVGAVGGYNRTSVDVDARGSSGTIDSYHLGAYAGGQWGAAAIRTGVAYSWHDVHTTRTIAFPGYQDRARASYDAGTFQAFGELGYAFDLGRSRIEPFANLAYVRARGNAFSETGGEATLSGAKAATDVTFSTLGMRGATMFDLGGSQAAFRAAAGWHHAFGDTASVTQMRYLAGGDGFSIAGLPVTRDAITVDAGIDIAISEMASIGVSYNGQIGSGLSDHTARATFVVEF